MALEFGDSEWLSLGTGILSKFKYHDDIYVNKKGECSFNRPEYYAELSSSAMDILRAKIAVCGKVMVNYNSNCSYMKLKDMGVGVGLDLYGALINGRLSLCTMIDRSMYFDAHGLQVLNSRYFNDIELLTFALGEGIVYGCISDTNILSFISSYIDMEIGSHRFWGSNNV